MKMFSAVHRITLSLLGFLLFLSTICFSQTGLISTVAGTGSAGYFGDHGPAIIAQFNGPQGLAVDGLGNLYRTDGANNRIRKTDIYGMVTTFAGTGFVGHSGDNGPATNAKIKPPHSIAADGLGNVYFTDYEYIRKVDGLGIITTIAGTPGGGAYSGDGSPATATTFSTDVYLAADNAGNIYVSDHNNQRIFRFNAITGGMVTTVAGTGTAGYSGDGLSATSAMLNYPTGITIDILGNIYFSDNNNYRIRKVNSSGVISTVAGSGSGGYSGDNIPATTAKLWFAADIEVDGVGNLYIPDINNFRIRRVSPSGVITTYAGDGTMGYSGDNGPATNAKLNQMQGIAYFNGVIYFSQTTDHVIRKIKGLEFFAPSFTAGTTTTLSVCQNDPATSINTQLAVIDSDINQTETWAVVAPPMHGSIAASYSTLSSGTALVPTGLTYTPATGYAGQDTFRVSINDELCADTIAVYVTVNTHAQCHVGVALVPIAIAISGDISVYPNPTKDELKIMGLQIETRYKLYNFTGICVLQGVLLQSSNTISMQGIPLGMYTLELSGIDAERKIVRVVKK